MSLWQSPFYWVSWLVHEWSLKPTKNVDHVNRTGFPMIFPLLCKRLPVSYQLTIHFLYIHKSSNNQSVLLVPAPFNSNVDHSSIHRNPKKNNQCPLNHMFFIVLLLLGYAFRSRKIWEKSKISACEGEVFLMLRDSRRSYLQRRLVYRKGVFVTIQNGW